jgi:hypothetical protein
MVFLCDSVCISYIFNSFCSGFDVALVLEQAKHNEADGTQATEVAPNARPQKKLKSAAIDIIKDVTLNELEE